MVTEVVQCVCVIMRMETGRTLLSYSDDVGKWTLPWDDVGPDEEPFAAAVRAFQEFTDLGIRKEIEPRLRLLLGKHSGLRAGCEMLVYEIGQNDAIGELQNRVQNGNSSTSYVNYLTPAELRYYVEDGRLADIWYDPIIRSVVFEALKLI